MPKFARGVVALALSALTTGMISVLPVTPVLATSSVVSTDKPRGVPPEWPRGTTAKKLAKQSDPVTVTTPTTRAVDTGEGTVKVEYLGSPQFGRTNDGWRRLSGSLREKDGNVLASRMAVPTTFSAAGEDMLRWHTPGKADLRVSLPGARSVAPRITKAKVSPTRRARSGRVVYPEIFDGVSLEYSTAQAGAKENFVLASDSSKRDFTFLINDAKHSLGKARRDKRGGYTFSSPIGDGYQLALAPPTAWSQKSQTSKEEALPGDGSAHQSIKRTKRGWEIRLWLDEHWAANAAFPVVLDPSMTWSWDDSTIAAGWGMSWWNEHTGCVDGSDCPLTVEPDGAMLVSASGAFGFSGSNSEDDSFTAGYMHVDLTNLPSETRIERATLRGSADSGPTIAVYHTDETVTAPTGLPTLPPLPAASFPLSDDDPVLMPDEDACATSPCEKVKADVTDEVGELLLGERGSAGFVLGTVGGCFMVLCRGASVPPPGPNFDEASSWVTDVSLEIEYTGTILPPPIPVDQTLGCDCGEWGTGPAAVQHEADPVNTAAGASMETEVDVTSAAPAAAMVWQRTYNGASDRTGGLGRGWSHAYESRVTTAGTRATYTDATGGSWGFTRQGDDSYLGDVGVTARLEALPGDEWRLTSTRGTVIQFNDAGRPTLQKDRSERGVTLDYSAGRLVSVTPDGGSPTTLIYGTSGPANGRVTSVSTPEGRTVSYAYATVAGDPHLSAIVDTLGETTQLGYDPTTGRLDSRTTPEGDMHSLNTFDSSGRITTQTVEGHDSGWEFSWKETPDVGSAPPGTGIQSTVSPRYTVTKQFYYGNVMYREVDGAGGVTDYTYDSDLNLVAIRDPDGYVTTMTYDTVGRMTSRTPPGPGARTESWSYNLDGTLATHTSPGRGIASFTYDSQAQLIASTDGIGRTTSYTYTVNGQLATKTTPGGGVTTHSYDTHGRVVSEIGPRGGETTHVYDAAGNLTGTTTPRGNATGGTPAHHTTTWTHDAAGNILTETTPDGSLTTNVLDGSGRRISEVVKDSSSLVVSNRTWSYDGFDRVLSETLFDRTLQEYEYDSGGFLVGEFDAADNHTSSWYDDAGRLSGTYGPAGSTEYLYSRGGRLIESINGDGESTRTTYGADSLPASTVLPSGASTVYNRDVAGRIIVSTDPEGGVTTNSFDTAGQVIGRARPGEDPSTYAYDLDGNPTSATSPSGESKTTRDYAPDGLLVSETNPLGNAPGGTPSQHKTSFTYDLNGNELTRTDPSGAVSAITYNRLGRVSSTTDARGNTTDYTHDAIGRLTEVTAPGNAKTIYAYDQYNNLSSRTDARGKVTEYTHDALGRTISKTDPLDRTTNWAYNPMGLVIEQNNASGSSIEYAYTSGGRLIERVPSDGPGETYSYNEDGLLAEYSDATGVTTLTYDDRGLLADVDGPADADFAYTYNPVGSLSTRTYPDGNTIEYTYDADGRVQTHEADGLTTNYAHDLRGQLSRLEYPSTVNKTQTRAYDRSGNLEKIKTHDSATEAVISSIDYDRDAAGFPTQITRTRGTTTTHQTYRYNDRNWLQRWCPDTNCTPTTPNRVDYTYDIVGNELIEERTGSVPDPGTLTSTYDDADQLTTLTRASGALPGATNYTYSSDGQLTTGGRSYNALGQLTAATGQAGAATYTYDAKGNRAAITTPSGTTAWTWDTNNALALLATSTDTTGLVNAYRYTPEDDIQSSSTVDVPGGDTQGWDLTDAVGSVRETYDQAGSALRDIDYDPWGTTLTDTPLISGTPAALLGYTGAVTDPGTQELHLRARDYSPTLGRFTAPDPLDPDPELPSITTYHYGFNNPQYYTDPSGMLSWPTCPDWICGGGERRNSATNPIAADIFGGVARSTLSLADLAINDPRVNLESVADDVDLTVGAESSNWCYVSAEWVGIPGLGLYGGLARLAARFNKVPQALRAANGVSRLVPGGGLAAHEAAGGHALARHLGRTDADLLARLSAQPGITGASSFGSRSVAERSVAGLLDANASGVSSWLAGSGGKLVLNGGTGGITGRYVAQGSTSISNVTGVRAILVRDANMSVGYRIRTAFPTP